VRVLILEDDPGRMVRFREMFRDAGVEITHAATASDAIASLRSDLFDAVFLDHDLGGQVYVDSDEPNTGFQVARALPDTPNQHAFIVVHSWNPAGAQRMLDVLRRRGCRAQGIPFSHFDTEILGAVQGGPASDADAEAEQRRKPSG